MAQFITVDADKDPNFTGLSTPKGSQSSNPFSLNKEENDPLTLARETKELEQRLRRKDEQISELERLVAEAEEENKRLLAEKKDQDETLKEYSKI